MEADGGAGQWTGNGGVVGGVVWGAFAEINVDGLPGNLILNEQRGVDGRAAAVLDVRRRCALGLRPEQGGNNYTYGARAP